MEGLAFDEGGRRKWSRWCWLWRWGDAAVEMCRGWCDGFSAVGDVADDGVADVGAVDAELVGAAGFGLEFEEGVAFEAFLDDVDGLGGFSGGIGADGVAFAVLGVDAEGGVDEVGVEFEFAVDEGHIGFFDGAAFELAGEPPVGFVGFGDEDKAGGVAVEAVDDAGAPGVGADGKGGMGLFGVVEQGVDERPGPVAAGGVDDQAGLFVEGEELFVFVNDVEGDVFRERFGRDHFGEGDVHGVSGAEEGGRLGGAAVDQDAAGFDKFLQHGTGGVGEAVAEVEVDALLEVVLDVEGEVLDGGLHVFEFALWRIF